MIKKNLIRVLVLKYVVKTDIFTTSYEIEKYPFL